jgi:two-component system, cell cycle response regulator DivK
MRTRTLLLIDPKPLNREVYSLLFERYGYEVHAVTTAEDGMQLALAERPSIVVTELFSRTEQGWWILEALRRNPATAGIPIIALTAHAMSDDRERAALADTFLPKPCALLNVVREVDRLCGGTQLQA